MENTHHEPGIVKQYLEGLTGRFADPLKCTSLQDIIGPDYSAVPHTRIDWVPRTIDIKRMASVINEVSERSEKSGPLEIVDVAGHSGFLDRLLLDNLDKNYPGSRVEVTVVDPDFTVTKAAGIYYKKREPRLRFETKKIEKFVKSGRRADIAICSWMRPEMDLRPAIEELNPEVIIFVKDTGGSVGKKDSFQDTNNYRQAAAWRGFASWDIYHIRKQLAINPYYRYSPGNVVLIMTRTDNATGPQEIQNVLQGVSVDGEEKYAWEKELPVVKSGDKIHPLDDFK